MWFNGTFLVILGENQTAGKKKKKNRGKKKSATASAESNSSSKTTVCAGQTNPPTIPIVKLFTDGKLA